MNLDREVEMLDDMMSVVLRGGPMDGRTLVIDYLTEAIRAPMPGGYLDYHRTDETDDAGRTVYALQH